MAAPTITWGAVKVGTSGANQAPTAPAGSNAVGDLLLIVAAYDSATTGAVPAGWHPVDTGVNTSMYVVYMKICQAAAEAWPTVAGVAQDYVMVAGRVLAAEHNVNGPGDIAVGAVATGSSTAINPPTCTGAQGTCDYLAVAVACLDLTTGNTITAVPSTYTSAFTVTTVSASSVSSVALGCATKALTAVSSEDPGTFTNANRAWATNTLLIPGTVSTEEINLIPRGTDFVATGVSADAVNVSATFTPTAGDYLIVSYTLVLNSVSSPAVTATDTIGGTGGGSWTYVEGTNSAGIAAGYTVKSGFAYRRVGTSPASGAITMTRTPSTSLDQTFTAAFWTAAGIDPTTPVPQSANNTTNSGTSLAASLSAAPAASSLVMSNILIVNVPSALTMPTGYLRTVDLPTTHGSRTVHDNVSPAQTVSWSWTGAEGAVASTIEFQKVQPAATAIQVVANHATAWNGGGGGISAGDTATTGTVTPVATNNFLVVVAHGVQGGIPGYHGYFDMELSTTGLSVGVWTKVMDTYPMVTIDPSYHDSGACWVAKLTGTATGTVSVTRSGTTEVATADWEHGFTVLECSGILEADPIIQYAIGHADTTSVSVTLPAALTTDSAVVASSFSTKPLATETIPSGYTSHALQTLNSTNEKFRCFSDMSPPSTTLTMTGMQAGTGYDDAIFAVELRPSTASVGPVLPRLVKKLGEKKQFVTNTTTTAVSPTLAPQIIGDVLVVMVNSYAATTTHTIAISTSGLSVGTWQNATLTQQVIVGYWARQTIFWAPITGLATGTITMTRGDTTTEWGIGFVAIEVANISGTATALQTDSELTNGATATCTLPGALTAGSALFALRYGVQTDIGIQNPAGYYFDQSVSPAGAGFATQALHRFDTGRGATASWSAMPTAEGTSDTFFLVELAPPGAGAAASMVPRRHSQQHLLIR